MNYLNLQYLRKIQKSIVVSFKAIHVMRQRAFYPVKQSGISSHYNQRDEQLLEMWDWVPGGNHTVVSKVEVNNVAHAKSLSERKETKPTWRTSFFYEVLESDQESCIFLLSLNFKINTKAVKIGVLMTPMLSIKT